MKKQNNYAVFFGMGMELFGIIITTVFVGIQIDKYMGWQSAALMVGVIVGFIGWLIHLITALKKLSLDDDDSLQ